ncbi:MAG: hypothetical protein RL725_209, partial [Actinomycetota bacterium]
MTKNKIELFDTKSRQLQPLETSDGEKLRVYSCGPTVYDYAHIGNARTYAAFDSIIRYLRAQRIKVYYLQNITDIDDKIIKKAGEEKNRR